MTIDYVRQRFVFGQPIGHDVVYNFNAALDKAIQSIYDRDYPVVQSTVFIAAVLFIVINLVLDLLYGVLDPRARA